MRELIIEVNNNTIVSSFEDFKGLFYGLKSGKYLVTVKDYRRRSLNQNAYYWGVMVPMVRRGLYDAGYDDVQSNDDAHEVIKSEHLKRLVPNKKTGEFFELSGSTAKLTIPEFNEFIERVCKWGAEFLGINIPSPNAEMAILNDLINKNLNDGE